MSSANASATSGRPEAPELAATRTSRQHGCGQGVSDVVRAAVRVAVCDTAEGLAAAARLFDRYRRHYGEVVDDDGRTVAWLTAQVGSGALTVWTAALGPATDPVGLATSHAVPASLALGRFWQLRDLYVHDDARRRGVAAALVDAVREAAVAAGATRLSLTTEPDNAAALGLYGRLGFRPVEGLTTLSLPLSLPTTP